MANLKIFYAVQATGNGHISRAIELLPFLQEYGTVDVFLSGSNSSLDVNLPVKYRSKGISLFYTKKGGLDYLKIIKSIDLFHVFKFIKKLPVQDYDIIINDFDCITSLACKFKGVKSINFGHQASFQSKKTPTPFSFDFLGKFILKKYATATKYVGLHFKNYDNFILSPIIKTEILNAHPVDREHIVVYLPHYGDDILLSEFKHFKGTKFYIFSKQKKQIETHKNVIFVPITNKSFNQKLISCHGVITGAGFETPAEALYLGKKLLCIPISGQYEQLCNAEALKEFGVPIIDKIDENFNLNIVIWLCHTYQQRLVLKNSTKEIVDKVIQLGISMNKKIY